jgi:hypothetical protein
MDSLNEAQNRVQLIKMKKKKRGRKRRTALGAHRQQLSILGPAESIEHAAVVVQSDDIKRFIQFEQIVQLDTIA